MPLLDRGWRRFQMLFLRDRGRQSIIHLVEGSSIRIWPCMLIDLDLGKTLTYPL